MKKRDSKAFAAAVAEIRASEQERRLGAKDEVKCPDCGATIRGYFDKSGRLCVEFVAHADQESA